MAPRGALMAGTAALASACSVVDSSGYSRDLAYIEAEGRPVRITVPATARVEAPFIVSVTTYGDGCTHLGDTQVSVSGAIAELRPYDLAEQDADCPDVLREFVHEAQVIFDQPGTATVRVRGRSAVDGATLVETRTVDVQPAI